MQIAGLEPLVDAILAGDAAARGRFWRALEPRLEAMLRRRAFFGRLATSADHRRTVIVEVMARLTEDDNARLRRFAEARQKNPDLPLLGWLAVVVRRVAIDHMRAQPEYIDRRKQPEASSPGAWRELTTLPSGERLGRPNTGISPTSQVAARRLLEVARDLLSPDQQGALAGWLSGQSFAEIAGARGCTAREAENTVRAALQRIRRHVRKEQGRE